MRFFAAIKLEELGPANEETKEKIENLLALPENERTFKFEPPSFQESSSTTFSDVYW